MPQRMKSGDLEIDGELYRFVNDEVLPDTGISPETFWAEFESIIHDLSPRNRELLIKRTELQSQINQWHKDHRGKLFDGET